MLGAAQKARKRGRFRPIRRRITIDIPSEPEMPPLVDSDDPHAAVADVSLSDLRLPCCTAAG
eukprot:7233338-Prymnesium_polylepis.1